MRGLDPFSKQITAIVFNKGNAEKRQMSIITGIDGMRAIAARSGRYRPDGEEPLIEYSEDAKDPCTNPLGIVKAVVRIYIADVLKGGGWQPVIGVAHWDEFAPIKDEWAYDEDARKRKPTGKQTLDGNWPKMGRVMICKCAEAQALRRAFPKTCPVSTRGPSWIALRRWRLRRRRPSGPTRPRSGCSASAELPDHVPADPYLVAGADPLGKVADRIIDASNDFDLTKLRWFESANTHPLREFWARAPGDALGVKKHLDELRTKLETAERPEG